MTERKGAKEMAFDFDNDPCAYDQKCKDCRWWGPDMWTGKMGCRLPNPVKKGRKTENTWCWMWERRKGICR